MMRKCKVCGVNSDGACVCLITKTSGAKKFDANKLDLSLIPAIAEEAEAEALMVGEAKYGRYNYTEGHKASKLVAALRRHVNDWFHKLEDRCPIDGQKHLGAAKACLSLLMHQEQLGTLIDDRFKPKKGEDI